MAIFVYSSSEFSRENERPKGSEAKRKKSQSTEEPTGERLRENERETVRALKREREEKRVYIEKRLKSVQKISCLFPFLPDFNRKMTCLFGNLHLTTLYLRILSF